MREPEAVIEEVQTEAAAEVAAEVVNAAATETAIVTTEVAAVSGQLAEHAEISEERHDEILEGQQWLENQFQLQTLGIQGLQSTLIESRTLLSSQIQAMLTVLETLNQRLSTGSNPLTPPMTAEILTVEPANGVVDQPVVPTKANAHQRRVI